MTDDGEVPKDDPSMMRYEDAPVIRAYAEVHPEAPLWGFFGQCLYLRLELTADRAGVIDLPEGSCADLPRMLAILIGCEDVAWLEQHLPRLMDGPNPAVALRRDRYLVLTRYCDAQYSTPDGPAAQRWRRRKQVDLQRAADLDLIDGVPAKTA